MMAPVAASLIKPVASASINAISRKGVIRTGKGGEGGFCPLLALPLSMKVMVKVVMRA